MNYLEFLTRIVDDGLVAARADYGNSPSQSQELTGSLAGFEQCRDLMPNDLTLLLVEAREETRTAFLAQADNYRYLRCREIEIEWVCNCVSAMLVNQGQPPICDVTVSGLLKAASVVGLRSRSSFSES